MPETQTADDVVATRTGSGPRGLAARPVEDEMVSASGGGAAKVLRSNIEDETHTAPAGRALKASTEALLKKLEEAPDDEDVLASHEEGDADEDEPADGEDAAGSGGADVAGGDDAPADDTGQAEDAKPEDPPVDEWRAAAERLETRNRELLSELETARKTPKAQRTERETALIAAETAYIDEGSVPALRKFLSVITGTAPDSKEVDAELAGVYVDLTSRELGVPLDENQRTLRDNARTRLLLARDKREKVEAGKKPDVDNSADVVDYGHAAKFVDNLLGTKGQSGASLADEYPMLMHLAQDFDGYTPGEVLARAIRQEVMTGTLDPNTSDADMIRAVAPKIEKHYDAVAKKIEAARAKQKTPGTTTPSVKPKAAVEPSTEQRQSTGARTLTNAAASRAPAKPPKTTTQKAKTTTEKKTRKDFPSDAAFRDYLLDYHSKS